MDISLIFPAFIAGIFTFLSPCILPLVPGYLGFISGVAAHDLQKSAEMKSERTKIFLNGVFFVLGFTLIFVLLGTAAGFFGQALFQYRAWFSRAGGILVIIFGLHMLNLLKIPFLSRQMNIKVPLLLRNHKGANSFVLGASFGFGWTPCIGPTLASILTLVAVKATAFQGGFLLLIYSFGLAIPFLAIAAGIGSASDRIAKLGKVLKSISTIGGLFLIFLGILLFSNKFGVWVARLYQFFDFINYDRLLDFL